MKGTTFSLGLIGHPLAGSRSPDLHQAALRARGLNGEYRLYPIAPLPEGQTDLTAIIQDLQTGKLHGLNVTIPHKQNVLPFLDNLSPTARAVGAVNTLFMDENRLSGDNTDIPGFLADLRRLLPGKPGQALVLGAGGSARAVVFALTQAGWSLTLAARRIEQAAALLGSLDTTQSTQAIPLQAESLAGLDDLDLIVNTTPVGMLPHPGASPWPQGVRLPEKAAVHDLIYKPLETVLIRQARDRRLQAFNGLGMLVEQAALSFERWTGVSADREAMWGAVSESAV